MSLSASAGDKRGLHCGKIIDGKFKVGELLGQDPFGGMYKCTDSDGEEFVIKLFSGGIMVAESAVPAPLHPNILVPQAISPPKKLPRYAVFESNVQTSLRDWMKNPLHATADNLISVMLQLTSAVNTMHSASRPLGMLCPETIFIGEDFMGKMEVYILDLDVTFSQRTVAHKWYQAPELLMNGNVTIAADIWAVGAIIYEVLFKKKPFPGKTHDEILKQINELPLKFSTYAKVPANFVGIIQKCLQKDPKKRYESMITLGGDLLFVQENLGKNVMSDAATKAIRDSIPPVKRISVVPPSKKTAKRVSSIPATNKKKAQKPTVAKRVSIPPNKLSPTAKVKKAPRRSEVKRKSIIPKATLSARLAPPTSAPKRAPNKTMMGMPALQRPAPTTTKQPKAPTKRSKSVPASVAAPAPTITPTANDAPKTDNTVDVFGMESAFVPNGHGNTLIEVSPSKLPKGLMEDLCTSEFDLAESSYTVTSIPHKPEETPTIEKENAPEAIASTPEETTSPLPVLAPKFKLSTARLKGILASMLASILVATAAVGRGIKPAGSRLKTLSIPLSMKVKKTIAETIQWAKAPEHKKIVLGLAAAFLLLMTSVVIWAVVGGGNGDEGKTESENNIASEEAPQSKAPLPEEAPSNETSLPTESTPNVAAAVEATDTGVQEENVIDETDASEAENLSIETSPEPEKPSIQPKRRGQIQRKAATSPQRKNTSVKRKSRKKSTKSGTGWASNPFGG